MKNTDRENWKAVTGNVCDDGQKGGGGGGT